MCSARAPNTTREGACAPPVGDYAAHVRIWVILGSLFLVAASFPLCAASLDISIQPRFNGTPLTYDTIILPTKSGQTISVSRLDMLLSRIALRQPNESWLEVTNTFAFISGRSGRIRFHVSDLPAGGFDRIRFNVGLPDSVNHADPLQFGPDHPLNPRVNGLHWNWQGGYVFLALEGAWGDTESSSANPNSTAVRNGGYSWHLATEQQLMTIEIPITLDSNADNKVLAIAFDLDQVFSGVRLDDQTQLTHSRVGDSTAAQLTRNVTRAFSQIPESAIAPENPFTGSPASPPLAEPMVVGTPYRFTFPRFLPIPALPRDNPLTVEGIELGRRLFHDPLLSKDSRQSCASCHQAAAGFADGGKAFSVGADGKPGKRNAMALFNLAWKSAFFWDGRAATLRQQALMPIQDELEMHESLTNVVAKLSSAGKKPNPTTVPRESGIEGAQSHQSQIRAPLQPSAFRVEPSNYRQLFSKAFGTAEINADRIGLALEQFLLTLTSYDSRFDRVMHRQEQFTRDEQRGFELFHTEFDPRRGLYGADCFHCHGGPLFQNLPFANNGLDGVFKDRGLFAVTQRYGDLGKFAVPSLRNVELTGPYMHDGRFTTLEQVIEHYSTGIKDSPTLDPNIARHPPGGVPLSAADKRALVAFLKTLTDEQYRRAAQTNAAPIMPVAQSATNAPSANTRSN
jgi:cytochrome c peroxidase